MSLFGIETNDDCREKLDPLLDLVELAKREKNREKKKAIIAALNSQLAEYCRKGHTIKGSRQMSPMEKRYFYPAIEKAYNSPPKLNSPGTWSDDLYLVEDALRDLRNKCESV